MDHRTHINASPTGRLRMIYSRLLTGYLILLCISVFPTTTIYAFYLSYPDTDTIPDFENGIRDDTVAVLVIPSLGSIYDSEIGSINYLLHLQMEYTSSYDNLNKFKGIYIRDKGSFGQPTEITAFGIGWRGIGGMIDGRSANEPLMGIYDFNLFPTELIETIEFLPPFRSFLYQRNAVGGGFNIVTQSYIAPVPYAKIRYSEGAYSYSQTDVLLSQDIKAGLNIMLGLQRQFFGRADQRVLYQGRFPNMFHRSEHHRGKIRWNLGDLLNLGVLYSYMNNITGLSGGVDIENTSMEDLFNEREAVMRDLDGFHRFKRHDLNITAGFQLLPDTSDIGTVTLYYSDILREYRRRTLEESELPDLDYLSDADYPTSFGGIDIKQWLTAGPFRIHIGTNWKTNLIKNNPKTDRLVEREFGSFLRVAVQPSSLFKLNMMIRTDWLRNNSYRSLGGDISFLPTSSISPSIGIVRTYRHPTLQELYWNDASVVKPDHLFPEEHYLYFAEFELTASSKARINTGVLYRRINRPIYYYPENTENAFPDIHILQGEEGTILTLYGNTRIRVGYFSLSVDINSFFMNDEGIENKHLPQFDLTGKIIYNNRFFNDNLDLQLMLEAIYLTEQYGGLFNPENYFTTPQNVTLLGPSGAINGSVIGKIGNARVHITYHNITRTKYMMTPFYPMLQSFLRFGITWEFLN